MAGMKTRPTTFRDLAIHETKCLSCGILLALLAFTPASGRAEETPKSSRLSQAQPAASASKDQGSAISSKEAAGSAAAQFSALRDVKLTPEAGDKVTVTVLADRIGKPNEFILSDPPRLVLDFPNTENRVKFLQLPVHAASVKRLRIQQFQSVPSKIARIVFDLEDSYEKHEITLDKDSVRITFNAKPQPGSLSSSKHSKLALAQTNATPKESAGPSASLRSAFPKPADSGTAQKAASVESFSKPIFSGPKSVSTQPTQLAQPAQDSQPKTLKAAMSDLKPVAAAAPSRSVLHEEVSATAKKKAAAKSKESPEVLPQAESLSKNSTAPPALVPTRSESSKNTDAGAAQKPRSAEPIPNTSSSASKSLPDQPSVPRAGMPALKNKSAADPFKTEVHEESSGAAKKETAVKSKGSPDALLATQSPQLSEPAGLQKISEMKNIEKPQVPDPDIKDPKRAAPLVAALAPSAIPAAPKMVAPANSRFFGQPLTLDLIDIPLVDFFRLMAEEGGINVVMDPEIKGHISIKVVKVPWDQIFEAALANNGLDKQIEGTLVRIARKSTLQDEAKQKESLKKATLLAADLETRIKRLNYTKAATLVNALADQKTVRGTVVVDERTNSLILTDLPSSLDKLTQLIDALDVPQPQVEIEARIVSASRTFARDIGIQWGFVDGNLQRVTVGGPNTFGTIGGTRPSTTPTSAFTAGNASTGRGATTSTSTSSGAISTGTSSNSSGNWNVNLPAGQAFGGLGISIGNIFDTFLLDAAITAGESKGLAKLISQPKVIAQNNSPAVITQGLRFPVQVVANNTVTVQFENAALTLTVTPQITYEGNIFLDLKVENNTPDFSHEVNNIPSIQTSESTTRVLVSDGGTTVIGGILIDNDSTEEDKVPGLGSLPLVGNLFRRTSISRSTQEVLFFVTPRIIK
jgi:type IV pilus assembly protein PilQ